TTIQSLQGNSAADSFVLTSATSTVASLDGGGGAGVNTLTGANLASTWTIAGANSGSVAYGATQVFSNIQNLIGGTAADSFVLTSATSTVASLDGGGGAGVNTLTGADLASTWTIA